MTSANDCFTLQNGIKIPCIGLGTWQTPDGNTCIQSVIDAVEAGYTHIDTAAIYGNEEGVGAAVKQCAKPRKDLFITSKLWNAVRGYDETIMAFNQSMEKLGLDYMDLYLIHWPNPAAYRDCWAEKNAASWRAMEDLYDQGRIRAIGVSNFLPHHLDALAKTQRIMPTVNQIRLCPGETQDATVDYCRARNIVIEAYSPLGTGKVFASPAMAALSAKYEKSIAQICIRWSLQMGFLPLPKSVTKERIQENLDVFDFELNGEDVALIADLKNCCGESNHPDRTTF